MMTIQNPDNDRNTHDGKSVTSLRRAGKGRRTRTLNTVSSAQASPQDSVTATPKNQPRKPAKSKTAAYNKRKRSEAWWKQKCWEWDYKLYTLEFIHCKVLPRLASSEQVVFSFVFMRTIWWLKEWETITMRQFVGGSKKREDGTKLFDGTGLSKSTVQRTLETLIDKQLVRARDLPGGYGRLQYSIPRVDMLVQLPCFDGENMQFTAPFGKMGKVTAGEGSAQKSR